MEFNKGVELDKQIYKEGEPTWGCKWGVLDVQDVKVWIESLKKKLDGNINYSTVTGNQLFKEFIDETAGDLLI